MKPIGIVTDSNSGYTIKDKVDDVFVLPMPFIIDEKEYVEGKNLTPEMFYDFMENGKDISTSQPPVSELYKCYTKVLENYEKIIHIPMSAALSNSYQTSKLLANKFPGRVYVVDARRISTPLRRLIDDTLKLIKSGKSAEDIVKILEDAKNTTDIYLALDTLKYLQAGGRASKAIMTIGTFLRIKPITYLGSEKAELYKNVKTFRQVKETLISTAEKFFENENIDRNDYYLDIAHTRNPEGAKDIEKGLIERLGWEDEILVDELSLSIGTHTGPNAVAIGITKKLI